MWSCDPNVTAPILDTYAFAGPLFVNTLQAIFAAQCAIVGDHVWPRDAIDKVEEDPNYDFIIVGAGSAGAVVANRLSEIPKWKVLLIEAGGDPMLNSEIPQLFFTTFNTRIDWGYKTEPQDNACRSYATKRCIWPRGKVLGGCSSINGMFYVRGNKLDYDEWAALGNEGWNYSEVLPYFMKSENFSGPLTKENLKYHGTGGYLHVDVNNKAHDIENIIMKALEEMGIKLSTDITGPDQMGAIRSFSTIKDGIRHNTARAFLSPIKDRPNLHVLKNAFVSKIIFRNNSDEVNGVIINKNGKDIVVNTRKEVIISAGAINSPTLLMHSGIGPKTLEKHNIKVRTELPVGENLQDHAMVPTFFTFKSENTSLNLVNMLREHLLHREGLLSDVSPNKVIAFINTTDTFATSPDIQYHFIVFPPNENALKIFEVHDFSRELQDKISKLIKNKVLVIPYVVLLRPKSVGRIELKSDNPHDQPLIYANYFDDPQDMETVLRGMKTISRLVETKTFKSLGLKQIWVDLENCKKYDKNSDDFLKCMASETTMSLYHPVGTVKMGPKSDKKSVVDSKLKVHGIKNLRVIDASVMPFVVRGNTNAPTIMIGEKGADMIKEFWLTKHSEL